MSNFDRKEAIYEEVRERIANTLPSTHGDARDVVWTTSAHKLGFARSPRGGIELFIICKELHSPKPAISRHLEYRAWETESQKVLEANRLELPNEPHFDQVAAFICAELQISGVDDDPEDAFRRSQELIEFALARGGEDSNALLGLCGEMLFLDALVRERPDLAKRALLQAWAGFEPSSRDFQLGPVGVEVKTTAKSLSEHHIQGPHQTEVGLSVGGVPETKLFLLSIGLLWQPTSQSDGFTLPSLVLGLADRLTPSDRDIFLARVRGYGGTSAWSFDLSAQGVQGELGRPFTTRFVRLYDLSDSRIRLPRSEELNAMDLVPESLRYRIRLPDQVTGTVNPVVGLAASAARVLMDADD
jgi:hypothetical protein